MGQNVQLQQIVENYFSEKKLVMSRKFYTASSKLSTHKQEVSPSKSFSLISLLVILDNGRFLIFEVSLWMMIKE